MKVVHKKTLLLVEDEALISMAKQIELEKYGYNVRTANTGEKAVEISKENYEIDLILMDIDLGRGIDGTETAEMILQIRNIPIVFLSSHTEPEVVKKTEKITSYGYVVKNSSITVLDASIKMAFKLFNSKTLLTEEKNRSQTWLENSPTCTKIIDLNLNLQYMSNAGISALKVDDITTLYGHPYPFSFYPEEFKALMTGNLKKVIETGEIITQEGYVYDVEGDELWFHSTLVPVNDGEGEIEYMIVVSNDITKQIEAKKAVEKNQEQVRIILEAAGEGIYGLDLDGNTTFINPAAAKMIGWDVQEIIGKNQHKISHHTKPDGTPYPADICLIYAAYRDGKTHHVDNEVFWRKDGSSFPVEYISMPIRDKQGNLEGAVVTFKNITEQKHAADKLKEREAFLNIIVENIPSMLFVKDAEELRYLHYNTAQADFVGFSKEKAIGSTDYDLFPKEEADFFVGKDREVLKTGTLLDIPEEPIHTRNGTKRILHTKKIPIYNEQGMPKYLLGISEDITDQKKTELALKKSEERYRTLFEQANDAIMIIRPTTDEIIEANHRACELFGYTKEALLTMKVPDIQAPEVRGQKGITMKQELAQYGNTIFESVDIHRDGRRINVEVSLSSIESTEETLVLNIVRDITERKKTKE